jgi:predicted nucleotidyltransferase
MTPREQIRQAGVPILADALESVVRRIIDSVQPERIILFDSAARGAMKPGSDVDLLVIKSGDYHHVELAQRISELLTYPHRNLAGSIAWDSPRLRISCEDPYLENGSPLC